MDKKGTYYFRKTKAQPDEGVSKGHDSSDYRERFHVVEVGYLREY